MQFTGERSAAAGAGRTESGLKNFRDLYIIQDGIWCCALYTICDFYGFIHSCLLKQVYERERKYNRGREYEDYYCRPW